ncbi:hypothetical protein HDU77_003955 [Chytriomyces hyalinus]|nr:hypothetical protein HDU77_003955 [Chytriomyces hyalinus]
MRTTPVDASETASQLLKVAQSLQYTWKGEMFSAEWLATVARHQGLSATAVEWRNGTQVSQHLLMGGLCLVAYDKDGNHEPCLKRGSKAHWALIHGFVAIQDSGVPEYLLCKHGKSLHQAVWSYNALFESCWNMERVNEDVLSQSRGFRNVASQASNPPQDDDYLELDQPISAGDIIDNNAGDGSVFDAVPKQPILQYHQPFGRLRARGVCNGCFNSMIVLGGEKKVTGAPKGEGKEGEMKGETKGEGKDEGAQKKEAGVKGAMEGGAGEGGVKQGVEMTMEGEAGKKAAGESGAKECGAAIEAGKAGEAVTGSKKTEPVAGKPEGSVLKSGAKLNTLTASALLAIVAF